MQSLFERRDGFTYRIFASGAGGAGEVLRQLATRCSSARCVRWPTRLKIPIWTRLEWPPIEWFVGRVDVAHGAFHLLPASRRARRVVTVFDLTNLRYPEAHVAGETRAHVRMLEHAGRRADALIAISQSSAADLVELLGVARELVHVVPGGVRLEEFSGPWDGEAFEDLTGRLGVVGPYFVHLGTLEPRKNLPRLLEAYARLRERLPDCPQLVLAGKKGWKYEPVFEAIAALGLAKHVVHTGYVAREDAVRLLRGAYACVYPSLYEGFGLPVLEAMAARTPVLTSNVSSLPEVVGDTGLQVDPENVEAIEAGMAWLLEHEAEARERAEAAYRRAQCFTWERSAEKLVGVYREVAGRA